MTRKIIKFLGHVGILCFWLTELVELTWALVFSGVAVPFLAALPLALAIFGVVALYTLSALLWELLWDTIEVVYRVAGGLGGLVSPETFGGKQC
jgi:hypothetical protein